MEPGRGLEFWSISETHTEWRHIIHPPDPLRSFLAQRCQEYQLFMARQGTL